MPSLPETRNRACCIPNFASAQQAAVNETDKNIFIAEKLRSAATVSASADVNADVSRPPGGCR